MAPPEQGCGKVTSSKSGGRQIPLVPTVLRALPYVAYTLGHSGPD